MSRINFSLGSAARISFRLEFPIHSMAGRNNKGRFVVGSKKGFRVIPRFFYHDLRRLFGFGKVVMLLSLPNKNYYSALVYSNLHGFFAVVAPQQFESEQDIRSLSRIFNPGNSMLVKDVPMGYKLYNISSFVGQRAAYARSAGCSALVIGREIMFTLIKLPSGIIHKFSNNAIATFGLVSLSYNVERFFKAGSFVNYGFRSNVRGVAKNPIDHPHGGGEGKKSKPAAPRSPWGWLTVRYSSVRNRKTCK